MAFLELHSINTYYGRSHILFDVSLSVEKGEVVSLIGRNGAGKSTTFRSIIGLTPPQTGEVVFAGARVNGLRAYQICRRGIGFVPEDRRCFPDLTVRENLEVAARREKEVASPWTVEKIYSFFPRLKERAGQYGGTLSGGEQQMLATARGLMSKPTLMLLDEPSMGLSPILVEEIFRIIVEINRLGTSILLVEQNAQMALSVAHRAYVLETGRIVLAGAAKEIADNPQVRTAYLGV